MLCSHCCGIESMFNERMAKRELAEYRRNGPRGSTRKLIEALASESVAGQTLLDIGGGVGAIQHELFKAGVTSAVDVDASTAYLTAARSEAERQGNAEETQFRHGNFVDIAPEIEPADIVTLDRVICCYPDMEALVSLSSALALRWYAVVYPRDGWLFRAVAWIGNLFLKISGNPFRTFIHPTAAVEEIIRAHGFRRSSYAISGFIWQVIVYARV